MSNSTLIKLLLWLFFKCLRLEEALLSALLVINATTAVTCTSSSEELPVSSSGSVVSTVSAVPTVSALELVSDTVLLASDSSSELMSESEKTVKFSPAARFFKSIFYLQLGQLA